MIQAVITPAAGKRLIAKSLVSHPAIRTALQSGTVVVIAGTTNGYVAEELLRACGNAKGFSRERFFLQKQAGILIGHPKGGTILAALQAVVGRRVRLILPAGLEKRVTTDLKSIAARLNVPGAKGARMLPVPGEVVTEIDAIAILTGASAELAAAGGICGAEGAVWLSISGTADQENSAKDVLEGISGEPPFSLI